MSLSLFGRRSPRQIHAEATPLSACRLSPTRLCDSKLFDVTQLAEIDADGVGRGPVLEYRRRWEGRCGTNSRKRELIEPRIAARLSDAHETERAHWSDRKCHRRTSSLARLRLFPREHGPDICAVASCVGLFRLTLGKRRLVGWSKCHWLPARSELRAFCLALVRFHCQFRRWLLLGRNYRVPLLWLALRQRERRLVGRRRAHLFSSKLHGLLVMVSFWPRVSAPALGCPRVSVVGPSRA